MRNRQLWALFLTALAVAVGQAASGEDLATIRTRLTQLEDRLHKAEALRDIKRLQYSYAHYAESGLWMDLGDLFATKGVAHYVQGDSRGPEELRQFYLKELGRGQMGLADGRIYPHIMIQPVVTIAGDGKTAKGRWHVIAMLGSFGTSASWAGVVYENRYVFEDGAWKIEDLSFSSQYSGRYSPPALSVPKWELPTHYTAQSAGAPAPAGASVNADTSVASANFAQLQQRYRDVALRAQQLHDEAVVLNLQHTYGYAFDRKDWPAVANLFANDGTLELGQRGVYIGKDRIRKALGILEGESIVGGEVHDHLQLATVVHVAPGGKTANARGVQLSVTGVKESGAQWEEGIFENTYVKQGDAWKIRSVHYYPRVITAYEQGWAKDAKPAPGPSAAFPPDRPSTETYAIYPKMYYPRFHYANPVTRKAVQYPPGIDATREETKQTVVPVRSPQNAKEFAERLNDLEEQINLSIAYDAVENLASANGYSLDESGNDRSNIHQTVQPVIQIASDGKSATVRARLLNIDGKAGELAGGLYEGRAISRNGVWSLENLTLKPVWSSPFAKWTPKF
jgi:SnoaL-like domain